MNELVKYLKGDRAIWMIALLFGLVSMITVYSFIPTLVAQHGGSPETHLFKHILILFTGFAVMYYTHRIDFKYFSRLSQIMFWTAVILLILTLFVGKNINGAKRWLEIPVLNQGFQTSDFAKLAIVSYVARMLVIKRDLMHDFKLGVWPVLWPVLLICVLIFPQDFSTSAMIFGICFLLMFIGKMPVKQLALIAGGIFASLAFIFIIGKGMPDVFPRMETWSNRIEAFWAGDNEITAENQPQLESSQSAIYNGGFFGTGPGKGQFKRKIPQAYADFFFASFIEEFGAVGAIIIMLIFMILLYRSVRIALKCEKNFGTYLSIGISVALMCQAMVNMAVPTGLVPVTGQNMPMLGLGGTSIWFTCISLGMILSVSRSVSAYEQTNDMKQKVNDIDDEKYVVT